MELGAAVLLELWELTFQILCMRSLGLAMCIGNALIWETLGD